MGDFETGYPLISQAMAAWRQAEGRICSAMFWRGEALGLFGLGRSAEAISLIDDAIAHCRSTGDRYMEPEVLRVKAEMLRADGSDDAGVVSPLLWESLEISRGDQARS